MRNGNVQQEMHIIYAALQDSIPAILEGNSFIKYTDTRRMKKSLGFPTEMTVFSGSEVYLDITVGRTSDKKLLVRIKSHAFDSNGRFMGGEFVT